MTITKDKSDLGNEADWDNQFIWLAAKLEKFDKVFRKRVCQVDVAGRYKFSHSV